MAQLLAVLLAATPILLVVVRREAASPVHGESPYFPFIVRRAGVRIIRTNVKASDMCDVGLWRWWRRK